MPRAEYTRHLVIRPHCKSWPTTLLSGWDFGFDPWLELSWAFSSAWHLCPVILWNGVELVVKEQHQQVHIWNGRSFITSRIWSVSYLRNLLFLWRPFDDISLNRRMGSRQHLPICCVWYLWWVIFSGISPCTGDLISWYTFLGAFWLAFGATLVPSFNAYGAYVNDPTQIAQSLGHPGNRAGLKSPAFNSSFAFVLLFMGKLMKFWSTMLGVYFYWRQACLIHSCNVLCFSRLLTTH